MNNPTWQLPNEQLERLLRGNADDIQQLQSRLFAVGNGETPSTLLITSCNNGEGKTTSAAVMAVSLCLQGFERVLLVDGVTHEPKLHELIDCSIGPGVSDVIRNDVTWQEVVVPSALPNLSFLPAGAVPVSETAVYRSARFGELVNELGQNFDCVIVDAPAYL